MNDYNVIGFSCSAAKRFLLSCDDTTLLALFARLHPSETVRARAGKLRRQLLARKAASTRKARASLSRGIESSVLATEWTV